ncbi:hypothetical protein E2C01_012216 [Portunus trituberculatus]|uniref:Uncharacterized protein n=1 Tax=Portunus trituberculatus TaxID=210409 RepID=A0A5B7DDG6_PORTR|nr:hypothetical protein [Portunus trituberculatus]
MHQDTASHPATQPSLFTSNACVISLILPLFLVIHLVVMTPAEAWSSSSSIQPSDSVVGCVWVIGEHLVSALRTKNTAGPLRLLVISSPFILPLIPHQDELVF